MEPGSSVWIVLVIGALVAGASFVAVLVVRQNAEALAALLGLTGFALSAYGMVTVSTAYQRLDAIIYALAFTMAGLVGGWALASASLDKFAREPSVVSLPDELPPDSDKAAVIVVACVEPSRYSMATTAGMLRSLAEEGLMEPSIGTLPFMFFAQKTRYRAIGGSSPAFGELALLAERLEGEIKGGRVGLADFATCSGEQGLARRVRKAAAAGHRRIIVVQLDVADSLHMAQAKREVDVLRLEQAGIILTYASPLADSDTLVSMLAQRVIASAAEVGTTGVVLVGHGQPEPRSKRNPEMDQKETAFLSRVRMQLIDRGIAENNIRIAWMEWRSPDVTSSVRHLAALGCERISVVPGVYPLDTLATRLDLELAVRQARADENVNVVTLPAWRDDSAVLTEMAERVERELARGPAT